MRSEDGRQRAMLVVINPEQRVPKGHPLRRVKALADAALAQLSPRFDEMYSTVGRPSIPPERLLKGSLLMALYTVRSERLLCEQLDYNFLFRWFLDLEADEAVVTALLELGRLTRAGLLALEALERSPRLDQRPVHGEVLVREQVKPARLFHHGAEELARHLVLQQPRAVARKGRVVEARLVGLQVQKPAEQKVVVQLLAQQPLAAYRVQRHQQGRLQQPLGRNRRPSHRAVHRIEPRRQLRQRRVGQGFDAPQRMALRHPSHLSGCEIPTLLEGNLGSSVIASLDASVRGLEPRALPARGIMTSTSQYSSRLLINA